jgi:hypothetical protein
MWSVRDAVDARLRNNSPSFKQRLLPEPISALSVPERDLTICPEPNTAANSILFTHRKRVHSVYQFFRVT